MLEDDYKARKAKVVQEYDKLLKDIRTFDIDKSSPKDLENLYKDLDRIKEDLEDLINEVEVEHFLECGPGKKDVTYEKE
jgi:hypothetical protein